MRTCQYLLVGADLCSSHLVTINRRQGSTDPHADALNYSSASLDKSSIASLVRKHQRAEEQGGLSMAASSTAGTNTAPQNKIQELLSSGMRPVWLDAKPGGSGKDARLEG